MRRIRAKAFWTQTTDVGYDKTYEPMPCGNKKDVAPDVDVTRDVGRRKSHVNITRDVKTSPA